MPSSLEALDFLSRSPSRIAVLQALREQPSTRDDLREALDASRTTLIRVLTDLEDRGWIEASDRRYDLTPEGSFLADEITRLLENLETAQRLDGALAWLPVETFDFELQRLADAEVVTLRWNDPASMRLLAERLEGADRVRSVATTVSREVADMLRTLTVEQAGSYEGVLSGAVLETIRGHPVLREQFQEVLASGRATLHRYEGDRPLPMLMVIDDEVAVCNHGSDGPQMEAILTRDPGVRSWGETYVDELRADARPVSAEVFSV